jgi:hypothetical protein
VTLTLSVISLTFDLWIGYEEFESETYVFGKCLENATPWNLCFPKIVILGFRVWI